MEEVTLVLELEEINVIMKALSKEPFKDVFELIGKINEQAGKQLQDKSKTDKEL
jgi:hypothetical protein